MQGGNKLASLKFVRRKVMEENFVKKLKKWKSRSPLKIEIVVSNRK